jgi:hypothetical protein
VKHHKPTRRSIRQSRRAKRQLHDLLTKPSTQATALDDDTIEIHAFLRAYPTPRTR